MKKMIVILLAVMAATFGARATTYYWTGLGGEGQGGDLSSTNSYILDEMDMGSIPPTLPTSNDMVHVGGYAGSAPTYGSCEAPVLVDGYNGGDLIGGRFNGTVTLTNNAVVHPVEGGYLIFSNGLVNAGGQIAWSGVPDSQPTVYGSTINSGIIAAGVYMGDVDNTDGTIGGGSFYGNGPANPLGGTISVSATVGASACIAVLSGTATIGSSVSVLDYGIINGCVFTGVVTINDYIGKITGGMFSNEVDVAQGEIDGGTFEGHVENQALLNDGTFNSSVGNTFVINNGTYNGSVDSSYGSIYGGFFGSDVSASLIGAGTFNGAVTFYQYQEGTSAINDGTFNSTVSFPIGVCINGGTFNGSITSVDGYNGTIGAGTFNDYTELWRVNITGGVFSNYLYLAYGNWFVSGSTFGFVDCNATSIIEGGDHHGYVLVDNNGTLNGAGSCVIYGTMEANTPCNLMGAVLLGPVKFTSFNNTAIIDGQNTDFSQVPSIQMFQAPEMRPQSGWPTPPSGGGINGSSILGMQ